MYKENTTEYVTVNENQDLWFVDYNEGFANYTKTVTLDDLAVNNGEYTNLGESSIYEYLESNGYTINEDKSTEEYIEFKKVSA